MSSFWHTWRKDIIRGAVLFAGVIMIGMTVRAMVRHAKQGLAQLPASIVSELRENFGDIGNLDRFDHSNPDLKAGPRRSAEAWTYRAKPAAKQWVWVRNTNGSVTAEPASGDSLEVVGVKTYGRSDPAGVKFVTVPYDGGIAICAVWERSGGRCGPGGGGGGGGPGGLGTAFRQGSAHGSDVAVDFTVRLPRGVRLGATTVNGGVRVEGASAPVVAASVNGQVDAVTSVGPVSAMSVNGNVHARMRAFADTGEVSLITVNGTATAELPPQLDADVEATTVNGSINTDYPLTITGKFTTRHAKGTIGSGGRRVHVMTVNGSINLRKAM
jgi:hypothetical protein